MRYPILLVVCLALASQMAFAADQRRSRFDSADFPLVPLRHPADRVLALYESMAGPDAAQIYERLPTSMRQDLWSVHFERALLEVPDPTPAQRSVILQALAFLASGALDLDRSHAEWNLRVGQPLHAIEARAREAFGRDVARAILAQLGPEPALSRPNRSFAPIPGAFMVKPDGCSCSQESDWCDSITNPDNDCADVGRECTPSSSGCGTLWQYSCDGVCA